jgi:hypothetical protein
MAAELKRLLVGRALRTEQAAHERLSKKTALAVFSSDALSSTAYATEEILLVLAAAVAFGQATAFHYVVPISVGIAILLVIVATSYRQTIHAYPSGGGAYIVAKENLGATPGLVAGAALLVDYVLTVSVSIAAGVAAITSMVQGTRFAWLDDHKVALCLVFIAFSGIHRGVVCALQYAKSIAPGNVEAVYVDIDEEATAKLREKWELWGAGVKLVVLPSPYRELTRPLLRYVDRVGQGRNGDTVTIILPEFIPARWWQHALHNQSSLLLKWSLLFKEGVIVISVPYHLKH